MKKLCFAFAALLVSTVARADIGGSISPWINQGSSATLINQDAKVVNGNVVISTTNGSKGIIFSDGTVLRSTAGFTAASDGTGGWTDSSGSTQTTTTGRNVGIGTSAPTVSLDILSNIVGGIAPVDYIRLKTTRSDQGVGFILSASAPWTYSVTSQTGDTADITCDLYGADFIATPQTYSCTGTPGVLAYNWFNGAIYVKNPSAEPSGTRGEVGINTVLPLGQLDIKSHIRTGPTDYLLNITSQAISYPIFRILGNGQFVMNRTTYSWPNGGEVAGEVLTTDGSGGLVWGPVTSTITSSGGGGGGGWVYTNSITTTGFTVSIGTDIAISGSNVVVSTPGATSTVRWVTGTTGHTNGDGTSLDLTATAFDIRQNESRAIRFLTTGLERAVVLSGGNFGIGATAPTYKLEVASGVVAISGTSPGLLVGTTILTVLGGNVGINDATGDAPMGLEVKSGTTGDNFVLAVTSQSDILGMMLGVQADGQLVINHTTYTFPSGGEAAGEVLTTNGSGTLVWGPVTSSGSAGGSDNLGTHVATQSLNMGGFAVFSASGITMVGAGNGIIESTNSIEIRTGVTPSTITFSTSGISMPEIPTPLTPASGVGQLFASTDSRIYWRTSGGTAYDLTSTSTGGAASGWTVTQSTSYSTNNIVIGTTASQGIQARIVAQTVGKPVLSLETATGTASTEFISYQRLQSAGTTTSASTTSIWSVTVPTDSVMNVHAMLSALRVGGTAGESGEGAAYDMRTAVKRSTSGAVTFIGGEGAGSFQSNSYFESTPTWNAYFSTTSTTVEIVAVGLANNNIKWFANADYLTVSSNTAAAADPDLLITTDTLAYWRFEENTGTTASDSTGSFTGTLTGGVTWAPSGCKRGNCIRLNGVDAYVAIANDTTGILGDRTAWTMSGWFKSTMTGTGTMYGEGNTGDTDQLIKLAMSEDAAGDGSYQYRDNTPVSGSTVTIALSLHDGNWHHICAISTSKSNRTIYFDGTLRATSTDAIGTLTLNTANIGVFERTTKSNYFLGDLDEFRLYKRALTSTECNTLYTGGQ